jgi:hypothetical protein
VVNNSSRLILVVQDNKQLTEKQIASRKSTSIPLKHPKEMVLSVSVLEGNRKVLVRGQLDVCEGDRVNIDDEKVENALEVRRT